MFRTSSSVPPTRPKALSAKSSWRHTPTPCAGLHTWQTLPRLPCGRGAGTAAAERCLQQDRHSLAATRWSDRRSRPVLPTTSRCTVCGGNPAASDVTVRTPAPAALSGQANRHKVVAEVRSCLAGAVPKSPNGFRATAHVVWRAAAKLSKKLVQQRETAGQIRLLVLASARKRG